MATPHPHLAQHFFDFLFEFLISHDLPPWDRIPGDRDNILKNVEKCLGSRVQSLQKEENICRFLTLHSRPEDARLIEPACPNDHERRIRGVLYACAGPFLSPAS